MAALSNITPSEEQTGVVNGVKVSAQQSNGRGRAPAEEADVPVPERMDWLDRCSRAD